MPPRGRVQLSITADPSGLKRGVAESEGALGKLGTAGAKVNRQVGDHAKSSSKHLLGLAKAATGAAAAYAAITDAKAAVDVTEELAKTTLSLHRNLGLSTKSASEFAGVAKVRGIESKALTQTFGTLSKQFVGLGDGSKKATDAFKRLGVTQKDLAGLNFEKKLDVVADAFGKMHGGAQRSALGMQLFGRGWQTVLPLMSKGSKGLDEQLKLADKYGVTFKGKTVKSLQDLIAAQRESKFATLGLQVAFGTQLAPALTKAINATTKLVAGFRDGTGAGGKLHDALDKVLRVLKPIATFLKEHPKLIAAAVAAWGTYKVAVIAATAAARLKLIGTFLGLGPKAAAGGAVAGRAFGTASATSAATRLRTFAWAGVGLAIGVAITEALKPQLDGIAQWLANKITGIDPKKIAAQELQNSRDLRNDARQQPAGTSSTYGDPHTGKVVTVHGRKPTPKINLNDVVSGKRHPKPAPHPGTRAHTSSVMAHASRAHGYAGFYAWATKRGLPHELGTGEFFQALGDYAHAVHGTVSTETGARWHEAWTAGKAPALPRPSHGALSHPDNRPRAHTSSVMAHAAVSTGGAQPHPDDIVAAVTERANRIDAAHVPYQWGGGHGGRVTGGKVIPMDCSGAVSAALGIDPRVSGDFASWGSPGDGGSSGVTVYANRTHVLMKINGRFWGTSRSNPGGGAGWIDGGVSPGYLSGFTARHMAGTTSGRPAAGASFLAGVRKAVRRPTATLGGTLSRAPSSRVGHTAATGDTGFTQTNEGAEPTQGQTDIKRQFQIGVRLQEINRLLKTAKGGKRAALLAERGRLTTELAGIGQSDATGTAKIPGADAYLSSLDRAEAEAALTPDTADDADVARRKLTAAQNIYDYEKQHPDQFSDADVADAARNLKAARDAVDQPANDALQANTEALNAVKDELKKQNDFATQVTSVSLGQAWRAIADMISGQITGVGYDGRAQTAGAGSLVRY